MFGSNIKDHGSFLSALDKDAV